jgi:hypothetical protein
MVMATAIPVNANPILRKVSSLARKVKSRSHRSDFAPLPGDSVLGPELFRRDVNRGS